MLPAHTAPRLEYVCEPDVRAALAAQLRALRSTCVTSPEGAFLKQLTDQPWPQDHPDLRGLLF